MFEFAVVNHQSAMANVEAGFNRTRPLQSLDEELRALSEFSRVVLENVPEVNSSDFYHILPECDLLAGAVTESLLHETTFTTDEVVSMRYLASIITLLVDHKLTSPIPRELIVPGYADKKDEAQLSGKSSSSDIEYGQLPEGIARQLNERLLSKGVSETVSAAICHAVSKDFSGAAEFEFAEQIDAAVDLAAAAAFAALSIQSRRGTGAGQTTQEEAPALWIDRDSKKFPTAESFLRQHYGPRLGITGDLTLADVGRYDTPLHTALNREFRGRRHELHLLLPTVKQRADKRLLEKYGYVPQGKDRTSKLAVMSLERKLVP